jgi:orotidine-5'-phosphate decarboxylase
MTRMTVMVPVSRANGMRRAGRAANGTEVGHALLEVSGRVVVAAQPQVKNAEPQG